MLRKVSLIVAILSIFVVLDSRLANGQEISVDGNTATIIMKNGDRITIDGNTLSKDGKNLFHSFREFGLTNQQIATFLTNPNIQNILTRVTGGNPSYINGLIEVVGGNSNLFLMNPAGIVFGQGASINVPADFTAITATGIGFNNGILNAIGNNDYQNLTGNPTNFIFNNNQPGSIINAGDLKVAQGSNINLIGGNVINTGTIETPNGKINIQAVEGTSRIKITPEGSLLSLEIDIPKDEQGNLLGFTPQDLPTLLTGANQTGVSTPNVAVKNNQVQVANTNIPNETGIAIASGKISTSSETLGGEVTVLGNKVGIINGEIEANGEIGGGKVLIGGDRQGKGTIPNASVTVVDKNSSIKADATVNGNGGEVIVFAENHASIHGELTAQGGKISGDGGFIETSGLNSFNITSVPDASAVNGKAGEWLIDPYDINIVADNLDGGVSNINTENPFIAFGNDAILPVGLIKNGLLRGDVIVSTGTGTDPQLPQEGNITWNSDATLNYDGIGTGKTLTLQAANNIIFNGTIDSNSTSDSLNVVFSSDFDNNQAGAIALFNGFINTNGGNIILAGAENSAAVGGYNPAYGTIGSPDGVYILNSTLDSGNGIINIIGTGLDGGITLQGNTILSTNNGNITLVGIAQGSGEQNHGIDFNNAEIANETIIIEATGSGNINLTGRHIGNGTGSAGILTAGDNPNNLSRITSNTGSITLTGETNATTNINTSVGVNILQNSQVNSIGGGNININATSINNNDGVDVRNNGRIITSGRTVFNTGNDDIFISNTSLSNFGTVEIISARNVTLKDINDLDLGTSNISQDLSVVTGNATSGGNITDSGPVNVIGATILNPNNDNVILDNSGNDFNIVSLNNANNVILADINNLTLSNVDSSGNPIDINISGDLDLRVAQINTINSNIQARSLTTDAPGTTILNGNVTTTRNQTYGDALIIGNSVSLATTNNEITFNNTVNSEEEENNNLTLNSGRRNLTFNQALGNNQPLGDITANSSGITRFNSTVNSNSLTTDAGGRTILSGNVTTTGDQTYNDNIFLEQNTILDTNNLIARSIEVNKELPNPISITINARDSVSISGKPDRIIPLAIGTAKKIDQTTGDITVNAVNNINLGGAVNTTATNRSSFAGDAGNISIISERGDVSIPGIATFGTISSGSVNISGNNLSLGPILTFLNPATGISNNINLQGNNITVRGAIQAESLTTSGNIILTNNPLFQALDNPSFAALGNANVTTIENQNYNNSLNILSNANLTSTQGNINFSNNVNTGSNNLNIRSLTGVNFSDNALVSSANGNLFIQTIDRSGNIVIGSGDENQFVINNLDQANGFNAITIGQNNTRGSITITENLIVNDPLILQARNIFVNQTINGNDNASITIKGAKNTTTLNADIFTQGNDIIIDDNVILGGNITLATNNQGGGNINILGTINGNQDLTLNAGSGNASIVGAIGNNRALNNLTVTANTTNLNGGLVSTTGNQTFNSDIQLSNNTSFQSQGFLSSQNIISLGNNVNITAQTINTENIDTSNLEGDGGNVTLSTTNDIEVSSIDTSSSNGKGGNVNITTLGRLRVTDTIVITNVSVGTTGTNGGGGAILIDFFPDNSQEGKTSDPRLPFVVGDPTNNGTKGIITNGEFSIAPDQYFEVVQEGNIDIILLDPAPQIPNEDPRDEKLQQLIEEGDPINAIFPRLEIKTLAVNLYPAVIPIATISEAQEILNTIEKEAAEKPAFIYVSFTPKGYQPRDLEDEFAHREAVNTQEYSQVDINLPNLQPTIALKPAQEDQLDLLVITRKGQPLRVTIPVTREQVVGSATNLWSTVSDIFALNDDYKPYATELYSWLVAPLEDKLKEEEISNLLFILPPEIRFIPVAALYDGNTDQFLVEKYSSGLAPSLNLNDNRYRPIKDLNLLAMGAAQFADDQVTPLPAVGLELPTIKEIWNDKPTKDYQRYLNNNFTLEEIKQNIASQPFGIVHFGTHGEFNPTETTDSFIQLYNSRLRLGDLRNLGLNQPLVELMVLSACDTAFGNEIAELGFAGLAVQAGVKTAMGSVWQVSDTGTLALMADFYGQLKIQSTKAESLRQAQLNMLTGKVYKSDDGNKIITPQQEVSLETLPENSRKKEDFSHPFYWAPFTMIGNPW